MLAISELTSCALPYRASVLPAEASRPCLAQAMSVQRIKLLGKMSDLPHIGSAPDQGLGQKRNNRVRHCHARRNT